MRALTVLLVLTLLAGCGGSTAVAPAATPSSAGVVDAEAPAATAPKRQATFSTEMLPSFARTGTIKADTALLQRPTAASVILKTLPASEVVQILGDLNNADGQWLSVSTGGMQGWVRAAQIALP